MFPVQRWLQLRRPFPAPRGIRRLQVSAVACMPRARKIGGRRGQEEEEDKEEEEETSRNDDGKDDDGDDYDLEVMPEFEGDDATSYGHMVIHEQRRVLKYLRLIERDGPALRQCRIPFEPPTRKTPLVVRAISYSGELHPALTKRVVVAAVSQLPLKDAHKIHKFKLLAGPRWTPEPPRDAGIGKEEHIKHGTHGYIKISSEEFPDPQMNLKWIADTLKNVIRESNKGTDNFMDIPLDLRHLRAKQRKDHRGDHVKGRTIIRPTIKDFPKEWLPPLQ